MSPVRILIAATAIELSVSVAVWSGLALAGARYPWLDVLNCLAPVMLALSVLAAALAHGVLERGAFRGACVVLALLATAYQAWRVLPDYLRMAGEIATRPGAHYRVVSANVYHANSSPFGAARDVTGRGADAVLVEESDGSITRPHRTFEQAYPFSSDCPQAGVRIWLKTPVLAQGCGMPVLPGAEPYWGNDFVWVRTMGPDRKPITLAAVHLGRPYPPHEQDLERPALALALKALPQDELILGGDFNTVPWSFAMSQQSRLLAPLRRRTLAWWSWPARFIRLSRDWGAPILPIDHLYTGKQWGAVRLTRFRITGSDHFGTVADLTLNR